MAKEKITEEEMQKRIARFDDIKRAGVPAMFIDSVLPGHHRMNFAIVGDTASENPEYEAMFTQPHKFQIGMTMCLPGCGPAYHRHDYIELFMPLNGKWRFIWGNDPDPEMAEGEFILGAFDLISFPPKSWRRFENISDHAAWFHTVLEPHEVFTGKDPYWSPVLIEEAERAGFKADEMGRMIMPPNYAEIKKRIETDLLSRMEESDPRRRPAQ